MTTNFGEDNIWRLAAIGGILIWRKSVFLINWRSILPTIQFISCSLIGHFLHHIIHFVKQWRRMWWKAVYVAFTCIKTFQDTDYSRAPFMSNGRQQCIRPVRCSHYENVNVIGHIPQKISAVCSLFIERRHSDLYKIDSNIGEIYIWRFGNDSPMHQI